MSSIPPMAGGDSHLMGFRHWSEQSGDRDALVRDLAYIGGLLDRIDLKLDRILNRETHMDTELTTLTNAVEAESTVVDSAIILLDRLTADIEAEKNDPIAIQAIIDNVNAKKQQLTDAIVANTPAAPPANDGTGADNPNAGEGDTPVAGDGSISGDAPAVTDETPPADPNVPATSDTNDGTTV